MRIVSTLGFFVFVDLLIGLILLSSYDKYCDVALNLWLAIGLIFSFPSSFVAHHIKKAHGHKSGVIAEVVLLTSSFFWMAVGTVNISMSTTCQFTNPVVWWTAFVSVTLFWCTVVGFIVTLILITIIGMLMNEGRNPEL
ncbi:putative integral membrane protein [Babesia bovis T2Bo]|uniref:putative integral membrane protein n=1 Tax=Babesia bovis T2Bo TaxID=484906 RepID=UPI001C368996|nr:putative integral membrane protein [Babesia bovis T2Bo]EDO05499.2 putative integral membrane protein [Babesia bovis T2Bo]